MDNEAEKDLDAAKNESVTPGEIKKVFQNLSVALPIIGVVIAVIILVLVAVFVVFEQKIPGDGAVISPNVKSDAPEAFPTPFPFQEMTIPYLRTVKFESKLGNLTSYSENANYNSYLTSYDSEGFQVNGLLTVPNGDAPIGGWPAIVFVHGYIPPQNYRTTSNYADYVDYLARNGFVVFKIDLRGHGDSEGEPGGGYYSGDYIADVLNARAALQDYSAVNPSRIGFWGHSMAGNVVSRAMAAAPDTPAISIWGGAVYTYTDFSEYQIEDNSYQPPSEDSPVRRRRNELFEKYGAFDPKSEFWSQVPMTNYLDEVEGAIQLNHAVNDDVVDIRYSRNFAEILDDAGITYEIHEYESGGHNITGAAFTEAMQNTVEFFKKYL